MEAPELTAPAEPKYTERLKQKWRELDQWVTMLHGSRDEQVLASVKAILDDALPKDDAEWDIYNSHHNLFLSDCKATFRLWRDNKRFKHYLFFSDAFHIVSGLGLENFIYLSLKDNRFEVKPKKDSAPPQPLTDDDIMDKYSRMGRLKMKELTAEGYKPPFHGLSAKMVRDRAKNPKPLNVLKTEKRDTPANINSNPNPNSNTNDLNLDKIIEAKLAATIEARVNALLAGKQESHDSDSYKGYRGRGRGRGDSDGYRGRGRGRGDSDGYRGRGGRGRGERTEPEIARKKSWADQVEDDDEAD